MASQGVSTEISGMQAAAGRAADCAQRLHGAVQQFSGSVQGALGTWQGDAPAAYWPGHEVHLDHMGRLVRSLTTMHEGITTSSTRYDATDQDSRSAQVQVTSAGSGIALDKLL